MGATRNITPPKAHAFEQVACQHMALRSVLPPVQRQYLVDRLTDISSRIEARVRVLKHHLDSPPKPLEVGTDERSKIAALKKHAAVIGREQAHDEARQGRLARP